MLPDENKPNLNRKKIYSFSISGDTKQREWSIFIVVAVPTDISNRERKLYAGKISDNSDESNLIINSIGEYIQFKNKTADRTEYNYHIFFSTLEESDIGDKIKADKINQLEVELKKLMQERLESDKDYELLNPFVDDIDISPTEREKRDNLLSKKDINALEKLFNRAMRQAQYYKKTFASNHHIIWNRYT